MGFGHGGPASVDLAALQFRRLQRLMADTQETDEGSSEPVRSGNPTSGEAAAFPELQHGLSGQFSGPQHADIKHPAQNQRRELSVKPRRHLLLQQLHPARLACSQVARSSSTHVATQRAATGTGQPASGAAHAVHDDTQLATGAEGARSEPNSAAAAARTSGCRWPRPTLPWEQLALEAHRAKRAAAKLSRTQSKQDGDDRTKQHAFSMLSDTGDDTDGFSSNEESEVSGGDSDSGAVWRPRSVADGLLGGSLEQQRLVVHRMLWGAKVRRGGTHRPVDGRASCMGLQLPCLGPIPYQYDDVATPAPTCFGDSLESQAPTLCSMHVQTLCVSVPRTLVLSLGRLYPFCRPWLGAGPAWRTPFTPPPCCRSY